jgi:chorismate-pyruvate lyase
MLGFRTAFATFLTLSLWTSGANADPVPTDDRPHSWPNSFVARVQALALLQTLNAELLSHDSATVTLERWCSDHQLASPPKIVAQRVPGVNKAPTEQQRRELRVTETDPVRYRRVKLLCGTTMLAEADNWYVPGRLTPEMNKVLDTTDRPFGRVVQPLHFQRHTISAKVLWPLLPQGWEMSRDTPIEDAGELLVPPRVLEHRAVLTLPDGMPISEVVETYTGEVIAIPMEAWRYRCSP